MGREMQTNLLIKGEMAAGDGCFYQPTVIAELATHEVLRPVVSISRFPDAPEAYTPDRHVVSAHG